MYEDNKSSDMRKLFYLLAAALTTSSLQLVATEPLAPEAMPLIFKKY